MSYNLHSTKLEDVSNLGCSPTIHSVHSLDTHLCQLHVSDKVTHTAYVLKNTFRKSLARPPNFIDYHTVLDMVYLPAYRACSATTESLST